MNSGTPKSTRADRFVESAPPVTAPPPPGVRMQRTNDHHVVRRWATEPSAEPATGEASESGPSTVVVNDGGAGIRFNFPGFAPFRPITWEEWLGHFDRHHLLFVFEEQDPAQVATRAYERSRLHDGIAGRDQEDWFLAERDLRDARGGASASVRYQLVKDDAGRSAVIRPLEER